MAKKVAKKAAPKKATYKEPPKKVVPADNIPNVKLSVAQTILGYDIIDGLDKIESFLVKLTPKKNSDGTLKADTVTFEISFNVESAILDDIPFDPDRGAINLIVQKDSQSYKLTDLTEPELALTPTIENNDTTLKVNLSCRAKYEEIKNFIIDQKQN